MFLSAVVLRKFAVVFLDELVDSCSLLRHSGPEVKPRNLPSSEKRPAASEDDSEASETEDRPTPVGGQTGSKPNNKKRRKRKKKKKAAETAE